MKTKEFLSILEEHSGKNLLFEYKTDCLVGANYHITEVKNVTVDAVDCGAGTDFWKETVIQLWESPTEKDKKEYMTAYKALAILNKVDAIKTMDRNAVVRFEYSNPKFHTAQLFVDDLKLNQNNILIRLSAEPTDCKAKDTCGVPETAVQEAGSCAPESGCC
ncbi:DUF6428 family protein [Costertonia aggregata]|uniref:Uncharacterized protein n=1 Tax=Costertonia aggregata TaxID=343403 RepID=A0A7H9ANL4_9FLAO|nr:DUF6428 family protein [Costertonia aggregata]QLG44865.1 hypothetical protein HYG79_05690 [Costertonia aggregata]